MKPIVKYMIKQFLTGLIAASVVYYLLGVLVFIDNDNSVQKAVMFGLIFSSVMLFVFLTISQFDKIGLNLNDLTDDQLKHKQKATINSKMKLSQIKEAIKSSSYFEGRFTEVDQGIGFRRSGNLLSWGEQITIQQTNQRNTFTIESTLTTPFQLYDFGANLRNIHELKKLLT